MYRAIEAVAGEITTQYILRYTPDSADAKHVFRNIVVRVNLANVKVRARKGYYPFAP
jgi:Ca-activated chloride channel homolog